VGLIKKPPQELLRCHDTNPAVREAPASFMDQGWSIAEEDERSERLAEIDPSAISLVTCLKTDNDLPNGEHCVKLLKEMPCVRLGGRVFLGLWERQNLIPENWKEPFTFVFFDGLILKHQNGNQYSLYLSWHDNKWHWYSCWLGNTRSATSLSAVLAA
jgi:hypothetical protein